jgi:polyphosphate kinase
MARNLDYRVEVAAPVYDPDIQKELRLILDAGFSDNVKARIVDSKLNNAFKREPKKKPFQSQLELHKYYQKESKKNNKN